MKNEKIIDGITIQFDTSDFMKFRAILDPRINKGKLMLALFSVMNDICIDSGVDIKKIFEEFCQIGEECKYKTKEEVSMQDFDKEKNW